MAELKTKPEPTSVQEFLDNVADPTRREDAKAVCALMQEVTGEQPQMWGTSMVGFGRYSYTYATGRSGEWFRVGFSPRKQALTLYLLEGFEEHADLLARLGKHSTGKSCLYIKRLQDVDGQVLRQLVEISAGNSGQNR
jgi:Domain of unknown function (DU1801)